ncbi:peptidoglycan-binding protein [Streptomyces sp. A5-4]|uniref:peptidoglycan-binding protein n=1 Tax=Streptomyces sp. A5-4 TaxID=3384771 RepID=UPI003DA820E5
MQTPVFEEYEPAGDCGCAGCVQQRRAAALGLPVGEGGHPAAHGARRALVLATAAGVVLGGGGAGGAVAAPATGPGHAPARTGADHDPPGPQGGAGPLHGRPSRPVLALTAPTLRAVTRAEIINRAKGWVTAKVPYSMEKYWSDGYRQDCSGFVSMAWNLAGNEWTGSLAQFGTRLTRDELEPGDMLLFHNPANPSNGSHVTIFGGWTDYTHTSYTAYEQSRPHTREQATPYAYWNNSSRYVAYRYKGLSAGSGGAPSSTTYPGARSFGPGANNKHVTRLGQLLSERGGAHYYKQGPGPRWGESDRGATAAFQRAQGWRGKEADGLPGPGTWGLLVGGQGRDIPKAGGAGTPAPAAGAFPGAGYFRPGQSNVYVEKLGKQLVKKGFGKHYGSGPGPRWTESDRRNVEAFQRAQGRRGAAADGYPGPQTWKRLFA